MRWVNRQETIGYSALGAALLLALLGWMGWTVEGEVANVPTPNIPERTYFADDPLPEQRFSPFLNAALTLTWDRDDIYVVIVDEDEKNTCEANPPGLFNTGGGTACTPYDADVIAGSEDGEAGLQWDVAAGVYYAGLGTIENELPEDTVITLSYAVHLQAGFAAYFVFVLVGAAGFAYTKSE